MNPSVGTFVGRERELSQLRAALESPEQARFRLFDSITTFLKNASRTQPLLLVLDDLHWADRSSLLLLEFLAREIAASRVMLLGTYRDVDVSRRHPLSQTLGSLIQEQSFYRLQLRGLTRHEVGQFVEASAGTSISGAQVELMHARTEGNPLFVGEIVRLYDQAGIEAHIGAWATSIPEGVRDVIGRRLDSLSDDCNQMLTIASVMGREFSLAPLNHLVDGISEDGLLAALDEALEAHVVEEARGASERYQFTHALAQETLVSELSSARRVRLHARIAEALEHVYGERAEEHAAALAHHFAEAEPMPGSEKLVRYSRMAGEQALSAYAWEEALTHFQRALAAVRGKPLTDDVAALHAGAGTAQNALRAIEASLDNLRTAFDYYVETGQIGLAVAIAQQQFVATEGQVGMIPIRALALELVEPDSLDAGRLLALYGRALGQILGDYEGGMDALAIARRYGDQALELEAAVGAANVCALHEQLEEATEHSKRVLELVSFIDNPLAEYTAQNALGRWFAWIGEPVRSREALSASLSAAARIRISERISSAYWGYQMVAIYTGDWEAARTYCGRALESWPEDARVVANRVLTEFEAGEFQHGEEYLRRLMELRNVHMLGVGHTALVLPWIARITGVSEYLKIAESAAEEILERGGGRTFRYVRAASEVPAWAAIQANDQEAAARLYRQLFIEDTYTWSILYHPAMLAGLLADVVGLTDKAIQHFEDALVLFRKNGFRPALAWTCHDYAAMLVGAGHRARPGPVQTHDLADKRQTSARPRADTGVSGPTDGRAKALSLLNEAVSIATELGMRPLMERASTRLVEIESSLRKSYPDGLTEREVEVLRLIAAGKSNREIGGQLFISLNTVARHVSNIFTKTGSANRAEAASYANRHSLME
jgi:DNA-binding CsgD family transcriptional regulator/tetratricopeptide (TPR) repeat protein